MFFSGVLHFIFSCILKRYFPLNFLVFYFLFFCFLCLLKILVLYFLFYLWFSISTMSVKKISLLFIFSFYSKWLLNKFGNLSFFVNLVFFFFL